MFAIDDSASSFCAREMRGTQSIASTVTLRREPLHELGVLRRPDEADQGAAGFAHLRFRALGARTLKITSALPQTRRRLRAAR